ncbi:hypothetical protein [Pseudomonas sp. Irchel s3h17]|uniref:hypothetical protein n=1 Tax=Pseudomonas sp. Irchel s3h17 TaxID=2009182 RepID=UPI00155F48E6|nr:hypothetical protein [Pseudomonas sp. Irchel s3h17]
MTFIKIIAIILVLAAAWYGIVFSVPRSKRGIASVICAFIFGCIMIAIAINQLSS